jgi:hypothetical protein
MLESRFDIVLISENVVNLSYIQNKCSHSTCLVKAKVNMAKQEWLT